MERSFTHLFCTNAYTSQHLEFFCETHHGTRNPVDHDHRRCHRSRSSTTRQTRSNDDEIAEDGMQLETYEYIDAYSIDNWTLETCTDLAAVASDALDELMTAPIVDLLCRSSYFTGEWRRSSFTRF